MHKPVMQNNEVLLFETRINLNILLSGFLVLAVDNLLTFQRHEKLIASDHK